MKYTLLIVGLLFMSSCSENKKIDSVTVQVEPISQEKITLTGEKIALAQEKMTVAIEEAMIPDAQLYAEILAEREDRRNNAEQIREQKILDQQRNFETGEEEFNAMISFLDSKGDKQTLDDGEIGMDYKFTDESGSVHTCFYVEGEGNVFFFAYKDIEKEKNTENFVTYSITNDHAYGTTVGFPIDDDDLFYAERGYKQFLNEAMIN